MAVAHSPFQQNTTTFCAEPISLIAWLCKHFAQYWRRKWDLQRGESNTLMDTHSDDSCQQHRGKYQYIVHDLISHTTAVVQVDVEGTCLLMDVLCVECWKEPFLASVPSLYCVVVLLWPWTKAEILGNSQKPPACHNPHTVRGKQTFGLLSGGDIRVQRLAVSYVRLLSVKHFFYNVKVSNMKINKQTPQFTLPGSSILHLQTFWK